MYTALICQRLLTEAQALLRSLQ